MLDTVYARVSLLEYLATSCAITHEIALNGIRMPIFRQFQ
ncbi:RAxF-45 family protein [Sporosarcina sp. UB5]